MSVSLIGFAGLCTAAQYVPDDFGVLHDYPVRAPDRDSRYPRRTAPLAHRWAKQGIRTAL